jgi:hypothetical protein
MARPRTNTVDAHEALSKLRKSIKIAATDLTPEEFSQVMDAAIEFSESEAVKNLRDN